jgi:hypothetical protein
MLMQPSLKHYADYFSMGLAIGLCSHAETIAWADQLIKQEDHPEDWMIELSTSAGKHLLDVIHLLDSVSGKRDMEISLRLLIAKLGIVHPILLPENGRFVQPKHSRLFSHLYSLALDYDRLPNDIRGIIYQMDCDLDYVEQGYGDWSIIQQDYNELLAAGSDYKQLVLRLLN